MLKQKFGGSFAQDVVEELLADPEAPWGETSQRVSWSSQRSWIEQSLELHRRWAFYLQLVAVEEAFKNLKGDLAIRPIFHQLEHRIEAHIFIAFLAYCLHVTLRSADLRQRL
jgi:hypothetical protein